MFTGLVEARAAVLALERRGSGARLALARPPGFETARGDSVSVSGCCLTDLGADAGLAFDLSAETLARTWLGDLRPGDEVNLERALRLGDRLGGHMVQGHVDGLGRVAAVADAGDGGRSVTFEVEPGLERWLVDKGSVTLDGVSLTVVRPSGRRFDVAVIPETLARTTLGAAAAGRRVHVEGDLVGKWVARLLAERG
jgi:riboflavin synthase